VIVFPAVLVVGVIGYNIEGVMSDKYTPFKPSIEEQRNQRQLEELQKMQSEPGKLEDKKFVPKTVFERNLSPQLQK
jgi:hypothetical protein